jgi:hypothetical protein
MSDHEFRASPFQFIVLGVIALGLFAAFQAGNMIAEGGFGKVLLIIAATAWILSVITIRSHWWVPLFISLVLGFSSAAVGFKIQGTDIMGALALSCLLAMLTMGQLKTIRRERNLGVFYYLTFLYIAGHTVIFCINNYFAGDTQFKNIAKSYYGALVPLFFLWLMDQYASASGLRIAIKAQVILAILFSIVGTAVALLGVSIPLIGGEIVNFSWADAVGVTGFLRWTILPVMMMAVCLTSAESGAGRLFYRISVAILFVTGFFGGGRVVLLMVFVFFLVWMAIRKKWRQFGIMVWLALGVLGILFVMGHTLDARAVNAMPPALKSVQRAISIFMPAEAQDNSDFNTQGSDQWHRDLASGAWEAATKDVNTGIFGNGFKGWDDTIDLSMFTFGAEYQYAVKMAIRMGATETHFFSVLTIFGFVGVVLYYAFMIELLRRTLAVMKRCPEGTIARSLCVFSSSLLIVTIIVSPIGGSIPSYNLIYWILGCLAAEPYLLYGPVGKAVIPARGVFGLGKGTQRFPA